MKKIGAEAIITECTFNGLKALKKTRVSKNYRNKILDNSIRKKRTRAEAKALLDASLVVNTPRVLKVDEEKAELIIEYIKGKKLKEVIGKKKFFCKKAGEEIKKIHSLGLIHGDLTTSNIIVQEKTNKLFFIDFGLSFYSKRLEDIATDLIVFKKTFNATHSSIKNGWALVMKGYKPSKELIKQMEKIEKRARYY